DAVYVIDASTNERVNTVAVKGEPFQLVLSEAFAYVRSLKSERVSMIALRTLGKGNTPTVQSFAAGSQPPRAGGQLVIADSMAASSKEASTFVVNPADNTVYFYMEGMNSPSSNYQVRGASARAVTVVDRSLKEVEPGVYAGKVTLPAPGHYDVAFMMQTPQLLHCFSAEVQPNPAAPKSDVPFRVKFDESQRTVKAAQPLKLRFTVVDAETGQPKAGLGDLRVLYYLAPGRNRTEVPARDLGNGNYEAELAIGEPGAYYAYVGAPSRKLAYGKLPYFSLRATP
ncbi:MAG TPA: cytochrome D1, partial [Burkholderiales bacterium]